MTLPPRSLGVAVVGCAIAFLMGRSWISSLPEVNRTAAPVAAPTTPAPLPSTDQDAVARRNDLVSYALAVNELHGLPPNAAPGTKLEVWVAWEPPVVKRPTIDRLLDEVVLEEISPPFLPDGPHVAMLLVERERVSDLLYGDRYGSLSVTAPQS